MPLGLKSGGARHGAVSAVGYAILLLFLYYVVVEAGLILGKKEILSPWFSAWLANMVFFVVGLGLVSRIK